MSRRSIYPWLLSLGISYACSVSAPDTEKNDMTAPKGISSAGAPPPEGTRHQPPALLSKLIAHPSMRECCSDLKFAARLATDDGKLGTLELEGVFNAPPDHVKRASFVTQSTYRTDNGMPTAGARERLAEQVERVRNALGVAMKAAVTQAFVGVYTSVDATVRLPRSEDYSPRVQIRAAGQDDNEGAPSLSLLAAESGAAVEGLVLPGESPWLAGKGPSELDEPLAVASATADGETSGYVVVYRDRKGEWAAHLRN